MRTDEIPQEIIDLLDARAGKKHSRSGVVVVTLAEILTLWEEIRDSYVDCCSVALHGSEQ